MSNESQGLVRNIPMQAPHKLILLAYANYADESGYCWPSVDTIIFDTGYAKSTVCEVRRDLIAAGWMGTKRRFGGTASTRLNLEKLAAAGVDRGDRSKIKPDIEFEPDGTGDETAGQPRRSGRRTNGETAGQPRRSGRRTNGDPARRSATRTSNVRETDIPTSVSRTQSISDPSLNSIEGEPAAAQPDRTTEREATQPHPEPTEWALQLVAELEFGKHRRPTRVQADELAQLVEAAVDVHGLAVVEVRRHCRAALNDAHTSGVAYLRGALDPDRLPLPQRLPGQPATPADGHGEPAGTRTDTPGTRPDDQPPPANRHARESVMQFVRSLPRKHPETEPGTPPLDRSIPTVDSRPSDGLSRPERGIAN